ncbi:hypothetical protein C7B67_21310 [filamentous cyanobacterium Phorm 6]|nr:hypothetical protein C7B67_21310 [filamentous cyanobacterium Phorm 6]
MIRRLALVSGLAVLSAVAFASQAGAQAVPQDVQFGGNITGTCTFTGTTAGTLATTGVNNPWVEASTGTTIGTIGTAGQTTVNCTSGGALSVAAPVRVAAPAAFVDTIKQAVVYDATANAFTSAGAPFDTGGWTKPTTALTIPANTNRVLRVGMITGLNTIGTGAVPSGTYTYRVTLTATPN